MTVCEECLKEKGYKEGLSLLRPLVNAPCEFCGKRRVCNEVQHSKFPVIEEGGAICLR